jgi:type II secretory pathway predicted ATPase ExeA
MIRSYFGIEKNPFAQDSSSLLAHQQEVYDILEVHSRQGGLCLLLGEPGTGKTVIKEAIKARAQKRLSVASVARTLHTYTNTIKILCQAFNIDFIGTHFSCEKRLIDEAYNLKREGNRLIIIIDDAHLLDMLTPAPHPPPPGGFSQESQPDPGRATGAPSAHAPQNK